MDLERQQGAGKLAGWLALVGALAAVNYAGRLAGGRPEEDTLYRWEYAISGAIQYAVILGILLLIARRGPVPALFGLRRPYSWAQAAWISLAVLGLVFAVNVLLDPFLRPGREQGLTPDDWEPDRAPAFFANALVVAGAAPVVEELSYRGLGFSLLRRFGFWTAVLASGVAFGLGHGLVYAFPVLAAFGIGLAYLRARTASVYPCIALHAFFNAAALALAVTV